MFGNIFENCQNKHQKNLGNLFKSSKFCSRFKRIVYPLQARVSRSQRDISNKPKKYFRACRGPHTVVNCPQIVAFEEIIAVKLKMRYPSFSLGAKKCIFKF